MVKCLGQGVKTFDMSQKLQQDHCTMKRFVTNSDQTRYVEFLTDHFLPWCRKKNRVFRDKILFMHDNAPYKLMMWPSSSTDLDPIKNLWSILKPKI
uniref:Tc1-like transposase DDE domain-containing protein n=1 Tax=Oryzias latipes TaxID=8090 RepID=A0A3P9HEH0_ORYLA